MKLLLLISSFFTITAIAQRPNWIANLPVTNNNTIVYRYAWATGDTKEAAYNIAMTKVLLEAAKSIGLMTNTNNVQKSLDEGRTVESIASNLKIPINKVCDWSEMSSDGISYQMHVLCQVAVRGVEKPCFETFTDCNKVKGNSGAMLRSIVPGWGQFYKGQTGKGVIVLGSEIALGSSAFYFESQRADNIRKSQEETSLDIIKEYRNRADAWEMRRNIAIGGFIGVYAFNLLDAALAKEKIKYAWVPNNVGLYAYMDHTQTANYGLKINF